MGMGMGMGFHGWSYGKGKEGQVLTYEDGLEFRLVHFVVESKKVDFLHVGRVLVNFGFGTRDSKLEP